MNDELARDRSIYVDVLAAAVEHELAMESVDRATVEERLDAEELTAGEALDLGERAGRVTQADFEEIRDAHMEGRDPDEAAAYLGISFEEVIQRVAEREAERRRRGEAWRDEETGRRGIPPESEPSPPER